MFAQFLLVKLCLISLVYNILTSVMNIKIVTLSRVYAIMGVTQQVAERKVQSVFFDVPL